MKTFLLVLICAVVSFGQAPVTPAPPILLPAPSVMPVVAAPAVPALPATPSNYPDFVVAMGGGYTRNNGMPNVAEGWVSGEVGLGGGNFNMTTVDMTSNTNTLRTGFGKIFAVSGNLFIGGRVDAGIQTPAPVLGSFAGGIFAMYDLGGWHKRFAGMVLVGEFRVIGTTGSTTLTTTTTTTTAPTGVVTSVTTTSGMPSAGPVTVGFYFGLGKTFKKGS